MTPRKTPPSTAKRPARAAKPSSATAAKAKPATRKRSTTRSSKPKPPAKPVELTNVDRVRADVEELGGGLERSALAGAALTLAADLDNRKNSATSHAMCAKALIDVMAQLRELAPPKKRGDDIDRLKSKLPRRLRVVT